jgi:hypothetical protein
MHACMHAYINIETELDLGCRGTQSHALQNGGTVLSGELQFFC